MRLPLTIKPWRCLNLPGPALQIALESPLTGEWCTFNYVPNTHAGPTPTGFGEIVSDHFSKVHSGSGFIAV